MNRKLYAVQIPPDQQECTTLDYWLETELDMGNMCLEGNRNYKSHTFSTFDAVVREVQRGDLYEAMEDLNGFGYDTKLDAVADYLAPMGEKKELTAQDADDIHTILRNNWLHPQMIDDRQAIVQLMSILSGHEWSYVLICGDCQSDWQYMYYDTTAWTDHAIDEFKTEYFNMGSEWCVAELDEPPERPQDIMNEADNCWYYMHSTDADDVLKELSAETGFDANEIVLYEFDRYVQTPVYAEYKNN